MIFFMFFKIIFVDFIIFNIELVGNYNYIFPYETLEIATVFPCMIFFSFCFFRYVFYQNYLC